MKSIKITTETGNGQKSSVEAPIKKVSAEKDLGMSIGEVERRIRERQK
jgi:hypothetical protein